VEVDYVRKLEWSRGIFAVCAGLVIVVMAAIFIFIGSNAYQTFTVNHISPAAFFFGTVWNPDNGQVGALILIVGTFSVTVLAVLLSTPLSVAVALFVTEVAPPWARRFMQPVLELLTGIPSIIYGLLALQILVPLITQILNNLVEPYYTNGFGIIGAALVLTVMILPTITTLSIDALAALPSGLREASLALGATRWQTIRKTLIPAASSGIFTGVILGMGRAIGETLAVSFIIGSNANSFPIKFITSYPYIELHPTSTMTVQMLFDFAEAPVNSLNIHAIWTLAFTLLVIAFLLVVAGRWIASRGVYSAPRTGGGFKVPNLLFLQRTRPAPVAQVSSASQASATPRVAIEGDAK
jgi:phosphate transport system permease protein